MSENLTKRYQNYAIYLPSLQKQYAGYAAKSNSGVRDGNLPVGFKISDLNFLNPKSKLWSCGNLLYSAGQFDTHQISTRDIVAERKSKWSTVVVGDSGGFQLGTGAITNKKEKAHLEKYKNHPLIQFERWQTSGYRERTLTWLEQYTDYAMTLDMVLWASEITGFAHSHKSPLRKLSITQLIDLSVQNLRYFSEHRGGLPGKGTKFLNVLQDIGVRNGVDTGLEWYNAVKDYPCEGWALGSDTGNVALNTLRWLRKLLYDGKLERTEWIHALMKSPPRYSVVYTAMQHAITKAAKRNIRISYDSSSPHQQAGKRRTPVEIPNLTSDIETWEMGGDRIKQNINIATSKTKLAWEFETPLSQFFTPNDLVYHTEPYRDSRTDTLSEMLLVNHNLYAYHRAALDACDLIWRDNVRDMSRVPSQIADMIDCIQLYFESDAPDLLEKKYEKAFVYLLPSKQRDAELKRLDNQ